jgi:osmotically-inducible protein OsmY
MNMLKRLSAALIAASMLFVIGCASSPTQENASEYMSDAKITTRVKAAIFNEPTLKVAQINVETYKRVVQLTGFVNSNSDINTAGAVARAVLGVDEVKNDIRLR